MSTHIVSKSIIFFANRLNRKPVLFVIFAAMVILSLVLSFTIAGKAFAAESDSDQKIVTFYNDGIEKTIITHASTVADAMNDAGLSVSQYDSISPKVNDVLTEASTIITIHRARMILVTDGSRQVKILTAEQSATDIAKAAGVTVFAEDTAKLTQVDDILSAGGAALQLKITRAKVIKLDLYGQKLEIRTQASDVAGLLKEKNIQLGDQDGMSLSMQSKITDQINLRIWRNGIQTVTATETINFATKTVKDQTKKYGFRETQSSGQNGQKTVIYQIEVRDGQEVSRTIISQIVNVEPIDQIEVIGMKSDLNVPSLSPSRGAQVYSVGGISRKETYYDLPMSIVMNNCGQGGYYEVRNDGVKVDKDGYVIVAANFGRYPRCSEVDTSVGRGKVYDTGGFAANNPEQFDIATDWSNRNGR